MIDLPRHRGWVVKGAAVVALLLTLLSLAACGGGSASSSPPPPPPPTITSVSVGAVPTYLPTGQQYRFVATVQGTGSFNNAVTWSVNGISGGDNANGTISSNGTYTAPAVMPSADPVTIKATSVQDSTKSGSAGVTVFLLAISPASASVDYGGTQQFTAIVSGIANPVLDWTANHGRIDQTGLYTAPSIVSQNSSDTVTLVAEGAGNVAASITLFLPTPTITSITPNAASAWETVTIDGQSFLGVQQVVFPGPFGTSLSTSFQSVSPTEVTATVPPGTVSGPVSMNLQPGNGLSLSTNNFSFTRLPNLRIRANEKDLSSSESLQFSYAMIGGNDSNPPIWTADLGAISSNGLYQAPVVTQETFDTVTACLHDGQSCDRTMLQILPLRITPANPVVSMGQTLQLGALEGSPVSANWSVVAGGGSVSSGGLFTAPTSLTQAGGVPVSATVGSASDTASVGVTGAFPGIISRTYDYVNAKNVQTGFSVGGVAINGSRAFTLDVGTWYPPAFGGNPPYMAIEVYDVSNPASPVWLGASEAISYVPPLFFPGLFSSHGNYLYTVETTYVNSYPPPPPSRIALYNIQSNPPQLVDFFYAPPIYEVFDNNGVIYGGPVTVNSTASTIPLYAFDITNGQVQQREYDVPPPPGADMTQIPQAIIGNGNVIYALIQLQSSQAVFATYDISVSPPELLGTLPFKLPIIVKQHAHSREPAVLGGRDL